ncbi:hypothetical protein TNCV_302201 [Trichonephila clavipes]|nr:hypothetical protein TNCV_302201 [Trichonephila clavipes]
MAVYRSPLTVTLWLSSFLKKYGPMIPPAHKAHQTFYTSKKTPFIRLQSILKLDFLYHRPFLQIKRSPLYITSVAVVAEWYRYQIVAGFVTSSSPVPLKTRHEGQRCTLNLSRAETSSHGVVW